MQLGFGGREGRLVVAVAGRGMVLGVEVTRWKMTQGRMSLAVGYRLAVDCL